MRLRLGTCTALLAVGVAGCVLKPYPPVYAQLPVPTLQAHGEEEMTQEGLTVRVIPIAIDSVQNFPQIWRNVSVTQAAQNPNTGAAQAQTEQVGIAVVPLPAFQVHITNNTGHIVRLTTAVFRLQNNVGKKFRTFSTAQELIAWNMGYLASAVPDPTVQNQLGPQIQSAANGLQLLSRSVELLKGDEWTGYLVFNMQTTKPSDYMDIMASTERFTLRLAEIPIETNDAGEVSKTTEFTFVFDKSSTEIDAVCPPRTKEPSWEAGCNPDR